MTDQQPNLAEVLDRVYGAVVRSAVIRSDGFDYSPHREAESIGAELGYTRRPVEGWPRTNPFGRFLPDAGAAAFRRENRLTDGLRILQRAGVASEDVEALRAALNLQPEDENLVALVNDIDQSNEANRQYWIEQYQRSQAIAMSNAQGNGRREALQEALDLTGDERFADKIRALGSQPAPKKVDTSLTGRVAASRDGVLIALAGRSQQIAALFAGMAVVSATHDLLVLSARYPKHAEMLAAESALVLAAVEERVGLAFERLEIQVDPNVAQ
jgi:hypothetical protein